MGCCSSVNGLVSQPHRRCSPEPVPDEAQVPQPAIAFSAAVQDAVSERFGDVATFGSQSAPAKSEPQPKSSCLQNATSLASEPECQSEAPAPKKASFSKGKGLSFEEQLAARKARLNHCEPKTPQEEPDPKQDEAETARKERETAEKKSLAKSLLALARETELGLVAPENVLNDDDKVLGHGVFASVVAVTIVTNTGLVTSVAAKRFGGKPVPAGELDVVAAIPLIALKSAKREVDVFRAVHTHPNIVALLGIVVPPVETGCYACWSLPNSAQAQADVTSVGSFFPLQLLLQKHDWNLYSFLTSEGRWSALARSAKVKLLLDCARGLSAIHSAGYAHLDIKSHNVLVNVAEGGGLNAAICDLGSAFLIQPADSSPGDSAGPPAQGTSGWTAPEILVPPEGSRPDARLADIFSFGVLVWFVSCGPGFGNPLCGLAGDEFCDAVNRGVLPVWPDGEALDEERAIANSCWSVNALSRPPSTKLVDMFEALGCSDSCPHVNHVGDENTNVTPKDAFGVEISDVNIA